MPYRGWSLALALALLHVTGCGDDDVPVTAGDAGPPPGCDAGALAFELGDSTGHAEPLGASATEARAGRIAAAQLPPDPAGLSTAAAGDFILANDRVAMIIEDVGESDLYDPYGGRPVGIARVAGGALVEPADFNELMFGVGRFTVATESVTVLRDGSDGGPAVVRAVGELEPIEVIDSIARLIAPDDYGSVRAAIDYELAPGKDYVDVKMTFASPLARPLAVRQVLQASLQMFRMPVFVPRVGFAHDEEPVPYVGYVEDGATSFAVSSPHGDLTYVIELIGIHARTAPEMQIGACGETPYDFARVVIGGPGLDAMVQAVARSSGATLREIRGSVVDAAGRPAAGVRVHAQSAGGGYLTRSSPTDAEGAFVVHVPNEDVSLSAWRRGDAIAGPVPVPASQATAMLTLAPAGAIHVVARDRATGTLVPARVQVLPVDGAAPVPPEAWGEPPALEGRIHVEHAATGDITLRAPVGTQRVLVSRGYEYELFSADVAVTADATADVVADLDRVVDSTGILCADYHIHTHRSPDSEDDARAKVQAAVSDGLEILVRSDHDWIADFEPTIAELGLGGLAFGIASEELTTFAWGHFGLFPLVADSSRINGGAVTWLGRLPPAVFADTRARPEAPAIIVNHPRDFAMGAGGAIGAAFSVIGSYFDAAGYDPTTGTVENPELWDDSLSVIEIFTGTDFEAKRGSTVRDWLSFLSHGKRVFAVGSSDSHHIWWSPVGYPRTCLRIGTDDPRALTPDRVRDVTVSGAMSVSGGILVDAVAAGGVGLGGEVSGAGDRTSVTVTVQAPSWVDVDALEVIVDGATTEVIPIDASTADPSNPAVRFRGDIQIDVAAAGSYAIFVALGDEPLDPVHLGRIPFGVTNPIFFRR